MDVVESVERFLQRQFLKPVLLGTAAPTAETNIRQENILGELESCLNGSNRE